MHASKLNQEAVNQFSQSYTKHIVDDFFGQNQHITGQQIISLSPIKQVNFFVLKVLFEEWQEEEKKFESSYFDYTSEEVSQAMKTLSNSLSKNIQVAKSDFVPLVEKAVGSTLEMMYDPALFYMAELKKLSNKDIHKEFKSIGKYFKLYKELFDQILSNIESSVSHELPALESVIKNTIESFSLDTGEQEEIEGLFNATLRLDVLDENTQTEELPEEEELKSDDEINFFDSLDDSVTPAPMPEPTPVPEPVVKPTIKEEVNVTTTSEVKTIVADEEVITEDILESKNVNDQFAESDIKTINDKFEEQEKPKNIATVHEEKPVSELASSININQRYMFINDLFEGNEKDYNTALDEIDSSDSFDSSVELLVQNYAKKYMWDMNSDEVKELLKVIFKRFR